MIKAETLQHALELLNKATAEVKSAQKLIHCENGKAQEEGGERLNGKNSSLPPTKDEQVVSRTCFTCGHRYIGEIECPDCKTPTGEPIFGRFHKDRVAAHGG